MTFFLRNKKPLNDVVVCRYDSKNLFFIRNIPRDIELLNFSNNFINKIEELPKDLKVLYIWCNGIKKIENLPDTLEIFVCNRNIISKIENLPDSLTGVNRCKKDKGFNDLSSSKIIDLYDTNCISPESFVEEFNANSSSFMRDKYDLDIRKTSKGKIIIKPKK